MVACRIWDIQCSHEVTPMSTEITIIRNSITSENAGSFFEQLRGTEGFSLPEGITLPSDEQLAVALDAFVDGLMDVAVAYWEYGGNSIMVSSLAFLSECRVPVDGRYGATEQEERHLGLVAARLEINLMSSEMAAELGGHRGLFNRDPLRVMSNGIAGAQWLLSLVEEISSED